MKYFPPYILKQKFLKNSCSQSKQRILQEFLLLVFQYNVILYPLLCLEGI
jgi:hypothetical protein